jgi:ABC-type antimicrobial peptide transport system permease subunit
MALGATAADIQSMVLAKGLSIATAGIVGGMAVALLTNRVLTALLYDVSPTDARSLASVAMLLVVIAAVASLIPARQSARIDPAAALRSEE